MGMKLLDRLRNAYRMPIIGNTDAYDPFPILTALFASANAKSGATVNWRTALEASTSFACARLIAQGIAQVPFKLMQYDGTNRRALVKDPLYYLMHDAPNEWMTSFELRETMGLHLVFCGGFFAFINRVGGRIIELLPYEPQMVTVIRDGWKLEYEVQLESGKAQRVPAANMWHVRGPSWNTWMGLDGVRLAREAIGLAIATEEHGSLQFKNGSVTSGILSTESMLDPKKSKELRESWEARTANGKRFSTGILWGGLKWQPTTTPNDQAQYLETRKFQVEEVCRAFGVDPVMVGYSDKASTYASVEQKYIGHVVNTLQPWGTRIEQSANRQLLTESQRAAGDYFTFVFNGLMRGAAKERAEYYAKALGSGGAPAWMTQDEVRELEDMNPMGGNAATLREPSNVTPTGGQSGGQSGANDEIR